MIISPDGAIPVWVLVKVKQFSVFHAVDRAIDVKHRDLIEGPYDLSAARPPRHVHNARRFQLGQKPTNDNGVYTNIQSKQDICDGLFCAILRQPAWKYDSIPCAIFLVSHKKSSPLDVFFRLDISITLTLPAKKSLVTLRSSLNVSIHANICIAIVSLLDIRTDTSPRFCALIL